MPTDEQRMREQFEKWIEEKQYGLGWQDGRGTWEEYLSATRAGYRAAWQARDAEVQRLRQALGELLVATDQISEFDNDTDLIAAADKALGWEVIDE